MQRERDPIGNVVARIRKVIESDAQAFADRHGDDFEGDDWFHLSACERAVFDIRAHCHWPRLLTTWIAYERCCGIISVSDMNISDADAKAMRDAFDFIQHRRVGEADFRKFAALFGMNAHYAHAVYWKQSFWNFRHGHTSIKGGLLMPFAIKDDDENPCL